MYDRWVKNIFTVGVIFVLGYVLGQVLSFNAVFAQDLHSDVEYISKERQQQIIYLLKQDCGSCHGLSLAGGLGPSLLPEYIKNKSDAWLQRTILDGIPNTAMPGWRSLLKEDEVRWLVQVLRTWQK